MSRSGRIFAILVRTHLRRTVIVLAWVGLFAGSLVAMPASAQTSQTVTVQIPATQQFTDTGIDLKGGTTVSISVTGTVFMSNPMPPSGDPTNTYCQMNPTNFPAPNLACWSVIARIGDGAIFEVGTGTTFTAQSPGRLILGFNDDILFDNSGEFTAVVTITPRLGTQPPNAVP
jgi:hypothetical protein